MCIGLSDYFSSQCVIFILFCTNMLGFHVSRWITTHGLALNCNVDLGWFDHIVACGLTGKGVTSLSVETWKNISVEKTTTPFIESFKEVFNCDLTQDDSNYETEIIDSCNNKL